MKSIHIIIIFLISFSIFANKLVVSKVVVDCKNKFGCYASNNLKSIVGNFESKEHIDRLAKIVAQNDGVQKISYTLKNQTLTFQVENSPMINDIKVKLNNNTFKDPLLLPISVGEFLNEKSIEKAEKYLREYFFSIGYLDVNTEVDLNYHKKSVDIILKVKSKVIDELKSIVINTNSEYLKEKALVHFSQFENKRFDTLQFTSRMEDFRLKIFDRGFYFSDITWQRKDSDKVIISIQNTQRQAFNIKGLNSAEHDSLKVELISTARVYRRLLTKSVVKDIVSDFLRSSGYANIKVNVLEKDLIKKNNLFVVDINVKEKFFSRIDNLLFRGNSHFDSSELVEIFESNAAEKADNRIVDQSYYQSFVNILKKKYISQGFVYVKIENPFVQNLGKLNRNVIFKIFEGPRVKISNLKITGLTPDLKEYVQKNIFSLQKNDYFNPVQFEIDFKNFKNFMFNSGYYFFEIKNESSESLYKYSKDNLSVSLHLIVKTYELLKFNNIIFLGNEYTKTKLLMKYVSLKKNDIIKKDDLRDFQSRLFSLGLFSSVNITPVNLKDGSTDIVVYLKEKNFGVIELAPGLRTDLGPKLSTSISYNNLGGMNRVASFKGQINQRFDLTSLDEQRRQGEKLLEYETEIGYGENKIFSSNWDLGLALSSSRRRLFQFDADIQKISQTFSTQFTDWFRFFITYQLETISQFNSFIDRENGSFQIGSVTPTFTFDFRNSRINPTSGSYFNLSFERANPLIGSQSNQDLIVDYYKIVLRNYFYVPFKRGTLAIALGAGIQENLEKDKKDYFGQSIGYIPNVKVFRLSGMDLVRGYSDEDINRLISGKDISEEIIDNKAYMVNLKLEPRYFVNDNVIAGIFFDAGRVFVNGFKADELRSSYGLTFKYLTPVGTLDFDYGIKVLRKRDSSGRLESPGRLHVSIGFF